MKTRGPMAERLPAARLSAEGATYVATSAPCRPPEGEEPRRTPLRAIRAYCTWCCCGSAHEVRLCPANGCPLHEYRAGHRPREAARLTPLPAIHARCVACAGSVRAPRGCVFDGVHEEHC